MITALSTEASPWSAALATIQRLGQDLIEALPNLAIALVVFVIFYLAGKGARVLIGHITSRRHRHRNLALVLGRLCQGVVVALGVLVACVIVFPNFTPASLLQLLGIGSVAIGFAFRDILQNYLSGILLLLTEPFRIGDQIIFKSYEGTVEDIQTRATSIKTYDGRRVVVPNAELFTNSVLVNTAFEIRRLEYDVGVGYGDDIDRAKALILEALKGVEGVREEPMPEVLAMELGASAVIIRARWWIEPPRKSDALAIRDAVVTAIKNHLDANGVDLPFPTTEVLFHDQTDETDGDRSHQREGWPAGEQPVPAPRAALEHPR